MKKILIILFFLSSFAFSAITISYSTMYPGSPPSNFWYNNNYYEVGAQTYLFSSSNTVHQWNFDGAKVTHYFGNGSSGEFLGVSGIPYPTCTSPQVIDPATDTCYIPTPTCTATQTLDTATNTCFENCDGVNNLQNGTGGCNDSSGFTTLTSVANSMCNLWSGDTFTSQIGSTQIVNIDGIDYETPLGTIYCDNGPLSIYPYAKLTKDYVPEDPCLFNSGAFTNQPSGYSFKGIVPNATVCASYVDGIRYLPPAVTKPVNPNCLTSNDFYCYLIPVNPLDIVVPPDNNYTIATDEPSDTNLSFDRNFTDPTTLTNLQLTLSNQILQDLKNNLQDMSLDVADSNAWFKNKFDKWEPVTDATNQLNATNNLKTSTDGITSAVNNQNTNLGTKLDLINDTLNNINDKNTSNDYSEFFKEDYEANGTGYTLTEFNTSVDTTSVLALFDNFKESFINFKSDLTTFSTRSDGLINTFKADEAGGFTLNLPHATVTSCPYIGTLDFSSIDPSLIFPISVDLCIPFSPLYPVFYIIFSIIFTLFIISFSFKSIMRLF